MGPSAVGPGFMTQTAAFTEKFGASFGFIILASIIISYIVQVNVWRIIAVSRLRGQDIANKVSQLKDHGASKSDLQRHKEIGGSLLPDFTMRGYNYRMTDMQGALGVCQMDRKEYIMNGRREVASKYDEVLKDISQLVSPYIPENYKHGYQSYVCIFTDGEDISNLTKEQIDRINIKRNIFMEKLEEMTIATRQGTHAVHTLGYYKNKNNFKDEDFLMSYAADRLSIALPLYAGMTNVEFSYIIDNIRKCLC